MRWNLRWDLRVNQDKRQQDVPARRLHHGNGLAVCEELKGGQCEQSMEDREEGRPARLRQAWARCYITKTLCTGTLSTKR